MLRQRLIAAEVLPCERKRYLALWHVHQGHSPDEIEALGLLTASCTLRTIHLYRDGGLDALKERVHPGRQSVITPDIAEHLKVLLAKDDRVWTSQTLVEYVQQTFSVTIQRTAFRAQLHRLGLSWQRTRGVVAGTGDPDQKTEFKDVLDTVKKGLTWGC